MKKLTLLVLVLAFCSSPTIAQKAFAIMEKFPACSSCGQNAELSDFQTEKYSLARIQQVFDSIAKDSGVEFNYPQGACQQRAQIMSMLLNKKHKIKHGRVWIFAPVNLLVSQNLSLEITDQNNLTDNGIVKWRYHVAPIVRVEISNGKFEDYVIDPSLKRNAPMLLKEWLGAMKNSDKSEYTILKDNQYYFYYANSGQITGGYYLFEGSLDQQNLIMESGLALNDTAMSAYNKFIKPLQSSNMPSDQAKLADLKKMFGNVNNLGYLLAENLNAFNLGDSIPRNISGLNHRQIMTKYPEIVIEMRDYYQKRLHHWTKVTNDLLSH